MLGQVVAAVFWCQSSSRAASRGSACRRRWRSGHGLLAPPAGRCRCRLRIGLGVRAGRAPGRCQTQVVQLHRPQVERLIACRRSAAGRAAAVRAASASGAVGLRRWPGARIRASGSVLAAGWLGPEAAWPPAAAGCRLSPGRSPAVPMAAAGGAVQGPGGAKAATGAHSINQASVSSTRRCRLASFSPSRLMAASATAAGCR